MLLAIFAVNAQVLNADNLTLKNECSGDSYRIKAEIHKKFDNIWSTIESTVGAEFFLNTLKLEEKMPSHELNTVAYYKELLKNIKSTSLKFSIQGLSVSENDTKSVLNSIQKLEAHYSCMHFAKN